MCVERSFRQGAGAVGLHSCKLARKAEKLWSIGKCHIQVKRQQFGDLM
jgi:hypothetical protein